MANPFTRPVAYKYKPLGFEAFAQPLAKKQASYDAAVTAYDDTMYDLPALPGDEGKVRDVENKLTTNLEDLRNEFTKTKDYKTATRKLKELNRYYKTSDETQSYRTNYDAFQEWKKERRKMVEKGKLSEEDYKKELTITLGEYTKKGGTNYDPSTKDYNPISLVRSPHNMDKEIQEWALKYAKADKANKEVMIELANLNPNEEAKIRAIKQTLKYNTPEEIASAVKMSLMGSDRFKEYLDSKADLNYRYNKLADSDWSPNLKDAKLKELDKNITNIQEITRGVDNSAAELVFLKKALGTGATDITPEALDKLEKDFITKYGATPEEVLTAEKYHEKQKEDFLNSYKKNPDGVEQELFKDYYYQDRIQSEANAMGSLLGFTEEDIFGIGGSGSGSGSSSSGGGRFVAKKGDDPILKNTGYDIVSTKDANKMTIIKQKERIINNKKTAIDDIFGTNVAEETDLNTIKNTAEKEDINQIGAQLLQTIYGTVDPDETDMMKTIVSTTAFDSENLNNNLTELMTDTQGASQKIKNILSSYQLQVSQDINDPTKFANDLRQFGIPITNENATELLESLNTSHSNGELSRFGEKLEALNSINRKLQTIQNREEAAHISYKQDKVGGINEVLNILNPGGKNKKDTEAWESQSFIKKGTLQNEYHMANSTWRNTIFDPLMYENSKERKELAAEGDRSARLKFLSNNLYPLSLDEVAQKAGYKNTSDAVKNGFKFAAAEIPSELLYTGENAGTLKELEINYNNHLKEELGMKDMPGWWLSGWNATKRSWAPGSKVAQREGEGTFSIGDIIQMHEDWYVQKNPGQFEQNIMAYEYSGNTSLTKGLTNIIGSIDQVPKLNLAFQTSWDDVPGFTTKGASAVLPDTKFATEKPKIAIMGDRLVVGIPYTYDDGGKDVANTVYVDFNTDAISAADKESMIDAILIDAHQIKDKGGHVAPYVFDIAQQARFNARYPNNGISTTYSNSLPLDKGAEVVMDEMPMVGEKGQDGAITLEIVKRQTSKDEADYVLRRVANTSSIEDGYIVYGEGEQAQGEIMSFKTPEAVKQYLAYQFLEQLKIRNLGFDPNVTVGSGEVSDRAEKYNTKVTQSNEYIDYRNHPAYRDYPEEFFE